MVSGCTYMRLLLRVGIKVADEGLISWGYVRDSKYPRTWIFGVTCLVFKTTCIDAEKPLREGAFSSREGHFSLRRIRGILAIR